MTCASFQSLQGQHSKPRIWTPASFPLHRTDAGATFGYGTELKHCIFTSSDQGRNIDQERRSISKIVANQEVSFGESSVCREKNILLPSSLLVTLSPLYTFCHSFKAWLLPLHSQTCLKLLHSLAVGTPVRFLLRSALQSRTAPPGI